MPTAILDTRLHVPRDLIQPDHFHPYQYRLRDGHTGDMYSVECFRESIDYWSFARGDMGKLREVFSDFDFIDRRISVPLKYALRFTGKLTDDQKKPLKEWIAKGYGMLRAPPRWGKTVWMAALVCKLRQRTLMMAHLIDLAQQLEETFRQFTNVNELEEACGIKLCGVLEDWSEQEPFPILTLSTYQKFAVSPRGRKVIKKWRDKFGLVMVDEAHRGHTELYTEVIQNLNAAYRCGVTATPRRKDGCHVIVQDVIGPVVTVGEGEQLPVEWSWENTEVEVPPFSNWATLWNRLVKLRRRTRKIATKVVEDVRAGHYVLVTTERLKHLADLSEMIREIDPDITVGELSGKTRNRKSFREATKRGDYQVVVAMNKIVELGYNIPRWSCFHNTLPMVNKENWYQRISRIRTPMEPAFEGDDFVKPQPLARVWRDYGHKAVYAYCNTVRAENKRLGFTCLNPEPTRKGKRKGLCTFVEVEDDGTSTTKS